MYHGIFLWFTRMANNIVYYYGNTGIIKVATHKLHDEFQYSSGRNKRSHASRYIVDLIVDDKDKKRYGAPVLDGTIADLIPTDLTPSMAAAATPVANDMEVEYLSPQDVKGFQSDSIFFYTHIKGGKHRMYSTPIVNCTKAISKDLDIINI